MTSDLRNLMPALIGACIALPVLAMMMTNSFQPVEMAKVELPVMTNGASYRNAVLASDYSDPDMVRVGPGDEFNGALGSAWQWGANPDDDWADLKSNPGSLRLRSVSAPANLWEDGAVLTQKLPGEHFTVTTKLTASPASLGERSGLVMYGMDYAWIGLERAADGLHLVFSTCPGASENKPESRTLVLADAPRTIYLRLSAEPVTVAVPPPGFTPFWPSMLKTRNISVHFGYSLDGNTFVPVGAPFQAKPGKWVGGQVGLFAQAPSGSPSNTAVVTGWADFDWFRIQV